MTSYEQAKKIYLASLESDNASDCTLATYRRILNYYADHCAREGMDMETPAAVASFKAEMSARGNKLATISMQLNIVKSFFDFIIKIGLIQATNPVLPDLLPPRKKVRAERKPYAHLMGEDEMSLLFSGDRPARLHKKNFLRNRAIIFTLLGCGLRNTELRTLRPSNLQFGGEEEGKITVWSGKGDKYRIAPFPAVVQQAIRAYLASDERPNGLTDEDILFGTGKTREEWRVMSDENLSMMCKRYIKSATGFEGARSHACRHAFASFNLTNGVPMAEIQSMLGHSSITTTEHYAALLRPTAPTASGNKVFNAAFANIV